MKQDTWWTLITLCKEDTPHSSWMEELHETMSGAEGPTKCQRSKSKKMAWQKVDKERVHARKQEAHE
jgi:hypothetical protein